MDDQRREHLRYFAEARVPESLQESFKAYAEEEYDKDPEFYDRVGWVVIYDMFLVDRFSNSNQ